MKEEMHGTTSRYYPVTRKDHGREIKRHNFCEHTEEGMDTHNTTHRYVPAQSHAGFAFSQMFRRHDKQHEGGMEHAAAVVTPEDGEMEDNKEQGNIDT